MSEKSELLSIDLEAYPNTLPKQHASRGRKRGYYAIFITVLPLLLHGLFVVATACFVRVYLDGRVFGITNRDRIDAVEEAVGDTTRVYMSFFKRWTPLQTDMITTLSTLVVVTRFFLATWCADVALKYILILLEKTGLSIFQIRQLITYKVLLLSGLPADRRRRGVRLDHIIVALVLFLPFPAHLSSPVITGSITWTPDLEYVKGSSLNDVPMFTNSEKWTWYQTDPELHRLDIVDQASVLNNLFYTSARSSPMMRTLNPSTVYKFPTNSTVSDILIPYVSISNLTWITDISQIPPRKLASILPDSPLFGVNNTESLHYKGSMALIPDEPWHQANVTSTENDTSLVFAVPQEKIISERFYLVFMPRFGTQNDNGTVTCDNSKYDNPKIAIPSTVEWYTRDNDIACFIFATVDVLAGRKICPESRIAQYELNQTVISAVDSQLLEKEPLQPDVLTEEIIWIMPQVLDKILATGVFLPIYGSVEDYIMNTLTRAYIVSWNALTEYTWDGKSSLSTGEVEIALPATRAVLSKVRLIVWIVCQSLVWVAAGIFAIVESRCKHPLTAETIMSLIFMDKDEEVRTGILETGLSDAVDIHPVRHNAALGLLKMNVDTTTGHSQLVRWRSTGRARSPVSDT